MDDIRWKQRFANFKKAMKQMSRFMEKADLNDMEKQGLVMAFIYTFELTWKTLQDLLQAKGFDLISGPRPVIEQCFQDGLIADGEVWMAMLKDRNRTVHLYDEKQCEEIVNNIKTRYYPLLQDILKRLSAEESRK